MNFERSGIHHKPKKLQAYVQFAELHSTTRSGVTKSIKCFWVLSGRKSHRKGPFQNVLDCHGSGPAGVLCICMYILYNTGYV